MRFTTVFLLCFPLSGLCVYTEAQEALYVYGQGSCNAVDMQNVNEVRMTEDVVDMAIGVNYRYIDIDSITFSEPEVDYGRVGWWGSAANGLSACYYQSFCKDFPDMTFEAADSICTKAFYFLQDEDSLLQSRRKVGRKWRYVKNTLSGRHKFQIYEQHAEHADGDNTKMDDNGRIYLDLSNQFYGCPVLEARKAVNCWYHRQDTAIVPSAPLFGTVERNVDGRRESVRYEVPMYGIDETICCKISFWSDIDGIVRGDSMTIVFPDRLLAEEAFELTDAEEDEFTSVFISGNLVCVVEKFEATIDDVMRWLVRFDIDVCKPVYIRDEE